MAGTRCAGRGRGLECRRQGDVMGVITISRHPGSLGDTLARAVAERLNYRLVDRHERVMQRGFDDVAGPLSKDKARDLIRAADRDAPGYPGYHFITDWLHQQ